MAGLNAVRQDLAIRGIEADIGKEHADTFRSVQHPDLRADTATRVSANPACAAAWRDLRGAQDHRSNPTTAPL